MDIPRKSTITLRHFGRRSGKPFEVTLWYTELDGQLWIGSLEHDKSWVRNVQSAGRAEVSFGKDWIACSARAGDEAEVERYAAAVRKKYPMMSRVLRWFFPPKKEVTFQLTPQ